MPTITKHRNKGGTTSYVGQVRVKGFRPVAKSFATRAAAVEWATTLHETLKRQRTRGGTREDVTKLSISGLITEYLADPETQALRTFDGLSDILAWFVNNYGADRVLSFGVLKLRAARSRLRPGRKPATVNRYLSAMRACWNWGRAAGLVAQDMLWPSRLMLTEPKGRSRYLSDAELGKLRAAMTAAAPTTRAAILVSIATGLRQSELLRLKWSDIDFERKRLTVHLAKNKETRTVHLPGSAADALLEVKRAGVVGLAVFTDADGIAIIRHTLNGRWKKVRSAAGLADFRWHDLRHSCASFLAQSGATLLEIGSVLGHKSPSVTQRYSHLVQGAAVTGHDALDRKLKGEK